MWKIAEVAGAFKIHENTIRKYISDGLISPQKKRSEEGIKRYEFDVKDIAKLTEVLKERDLY